MKTLLRKEREVISNYTIATQSITNCFIPPRIKDETVQYFIKESHTFLFSPVLLSDDISRQQEEKEKVHHVASVEKEAPISSLQLYSGETKHLTENMIDADTKTMRELRRSAANDAIPLILIYMVFFYAVRKLQAFVRKSHPQLPEMSEEASTSQSPLVDKILARSALNQGLLENKEEELQRRITTEWSPLIPLLDPGFHLGRQHVRPARNQIQFEPAAHLRGLLLR